MLEIKQIYISLSTTRKIYSIPFDNLNNHIVYGRKKIEDFYTAYIYPIPLKELQYFDGKIDFTQFPNLLNEYDSIKIVQLKDKANRNIYFSNMGNITPDNLEIEFGEIIEHLNTLEDLIMKKYILLDDEIPGEQRLLPKLQESTFWVYEDGRVIPKSLNYLKIEYEKYLNELQKDFDTKHNILVDLRNETKIYRDSTEAIANKIYDIFYKYYPNEGFIICGTDGDGIENIIHGGLA